VARQAEAIRTAVIPGLMASVVAFDRLFETAAYRVYLERVLEESGNPIDPIERMLIEQLSLAHFRVGQLHASAGQAQALEGVKVYSAAAARLWGEFRRTALALRIYRAGVPDGKAQAKAKVFRMAQ
jgi:hypothetical protein